jgi:aldose 1-epimerase
MPHGPRHDTVTLRQGPIELQIVPGLGACWVALLYGAPGRAPVDILRPMPLTSQDLFESAGYVLVPYSNRLFGQTLLAGNGQGHAIALNRPGMADPVHGLGWMKSWEVRARSADAMTLCYQHDADSHWPYTHSCELQLAVRDASVCLRMTISNHSRLPMPVGMGFHPFLAIDDDSRLSFGVAARWEQDQNGEPTQPLPVPEMATSGHRVAGLEVNHCFSGWKGPVRLTRPRHGVAVELRASPELDHLQVYRRAGMPWVCAEPVSHATGAWSLPQVHHASAGLRWLPQGAQFQAWMELCVRTD